MRAQDTENKKEKTKKVGNRRPPYGKPYDSIRNITLRRGGAVIDANGETNYNTPVAHTDFEAAVLKSLRKLSDDKRALVLVFSEALYEPILPEKAPESYRKRKDRSETIIAFLKRVYFDQGYTEINRPYLRKVDASAYDALRNYIRANGEPKGFKIPSKETIGDKVADAIFSVTPDPRALTNRLLSLAQIMRLRL